MDVDENNSSASDENESNDPDVGPVLCGWTREDKYTLLQAIKFSDSSEIERLQIMLPRKTPQQINEAISYYKKKAMAHPMVVERLNKERKAVNNVSQVPLTQWAKYLTDTFSSQDLQTDTATALRLIAEFDNIPAPVCTGSVDFKAIYHALANSMEAKGLPDDKMINAILEKCIIETAYASKAFIRNSTFQSVVRDINVSDKELGSFFKPTDNPELDTIRYLARQKRYNPLNINEKYLKPSLHNN